MVGPTLTASMIVTCRVNNKFNPSILVISLFYLIFELPIALAGFAKMKMNECPIRSDFLGLVA